MRSHLWTWGKSSLLPLQRDRTKEAAELSRAEPNMAADLVTDSASWPLLCHSSWLSDALWVCRADARLLHIPRAPVCYKHICAVCFQSSGTQSITERFRINTAPPDLMQHKRLWKEDICLGWKRDGFTAPFCTMSPSHLQINREMFSSFLKNWSSASVLTAKTKEE